MKLFKFLIILILLALVGGFAYFSFTDVKIEQKIVEKEIPNTRFSTQ